MKSNGEAQAEPRIPPQEVLAQLDHVLSSDRFRKSPSLSHLLRYLVTETLDGFTDHLKETVIGIEVFGRRSDFDGRIDNIVRVQAHRLRKSLESYYAEEGREEKLRFFIPKGSYIPQCQLLSGDRTAEVETPLPLGPQADGPVQSPSASPSFNAPRFRTRSLVGLGLAFVTGCGFAAALFVADTPRKISMLWNRKSASDTLLAPPLSQVWSGFGRPGVKSIAAFTNPTFLRTDSGLFLVYRGPLSAPTGARLEISPTDPHVSREVIEKVGPRFFFSDSWTGTGEVMAVHKLTQLFAESGVALTVKRSRTLSLDDLRDSNLIFVGSPWGNPVLEKIRIAETPFACCEGSELLNRSPNSGEPASYVSTRDSRTNELSATYALFSVLPAATPGRKIVISAGLSTHASWTGIDFATSLSGAAELIEYFKSAGFRQLPEFFQAVIRTEMINGEPSKNFLITARSVEPGSSSTPAQTAAAK